jgi:hypothetical protein
MIPTLDEIEGVYVAVTCESIINGYETWPNEEVAERESVLARKALFNYFSPLARVKAHLAPTEDDITLDHVHPTEHGIEAHVYTWQVSTFLNVEEWEQVADWYGIELDGLAVPERHVDTMGIISEYGHLPAVAIEGTDEGWNSGMWEPALLASFYVAVLMKEVAS